MEVGRPAMNRTGAEADELREVFVLDTTAPGAAPRGFDTFRRGWEAQIGKDLPLVTYSPATIADFRVKLRVTRLRDVVIGDLHAMSAIRTADHPGGDQDLVEVHILRRGAWTVGGLPDRGEHTVSTGQFLLRHFGRQVPFERHAQTRELLLFLPSAMLRPVLGNRTITGPGNSAEMRLLRAHTEMIQRTVTGLGPAGVHAAHRVLIELTKAVAGGGFDDVEPRLAPALVQAAKDLADSGLADAELSPTALARQLNVSVRTLQRAFAKVGESVTAYVRHRRLEEARLALTAPRGRVSVSELAAHWQFADSSHFIRAFKKRYGQTPTEYVRSTTWRDVEGRGRRRSDGKPGPVETGPGP
ncbi:transcriptional regulator [Streptomyces aurantiacus]|uniref:Transcriptional regulator n=2 Tax=Streptomyces aurantiacus TaxID=47760 RepID=A0A7G1NSK8_9ACTN|nr:transcriptional regulator [Streptomyces aurantiacus]